MFQCVCFNRSLNLHARDYVSGSIYGSCTRNDKSNINNEKMYSLELVSVSPSGCSCLYKMDTRESERGSTICRSVWSHDQEEHLLYSTLEECGKVLILYLLPLILLGTTSVIIGLSLRKRRPLGNSETQERISAQNQRIFELLVSIVVLFSFCWLFAHVNHLISVLSLSKYCALRPAPVPLLFFWISHTNAAINSIIYFIFNSKFRQGLREVFRVRETIPLQTRHIQFSSQKFCIRRNGVCRKYRHHGNP